MNEYSQKTVQIKLNGILADLPSALCSGAQRGGKLSRKVERRR